MAANSDPDDTSRVHAERAITAALHRDARGADRRDIEPAWTEQRRSAAAELA